MSFNGFGGLLDDPYYSVPGHEGLRTPKPAPVDNRIWQEKVRDFGNEWSNYLFGPHLPTVGGILEFNDAADVIDAAENNHQMMGALSEGRYGDAARWVPFAAVSNLAALFPAFSAGPFDNVARAPEGGPVGSPQTMPQPPALPPGPPSLNTILAQNPQWRITPKDLEGAVVVPTVADNTIADTLYTGIDSSRLDDPEVMKGGMGYPFLQESQANDLIWANDGTHIATKKLGKKPDLIAVSAMSPDSHLSNSSLSNAIVKTAGAYARDKRITPEGIAALDAMIKRPSTDPKLEGLQKFPGIQSPNLSEWMRSATFEQRKRIADIIRSEEAFGYGAPNIERIRQETFDPRFAHLNPLDTMLFIKPDPTKPPVDLAAAGLPVHPAFKYGIQGEVFGLLDQPASSKSLFTDYWDDPATKLQHPAQARRGFDMKLPVQQIGSDQVRRMTEEQVLGGVPNLTGPEARIATDAVLDSWRTLDRSVKEGGLSPAEFEKAIRNSSYRPALTSYTAEQVRVKNKAGLMDVFQLGNNQVFFGLDKAPDYSWAGVTSQPGDKAIVGVVSNVQGQRGMSMPAVMTKALEQGATLLDAFAVKSTKYPAGFLPTKYADYGFQEAARVPFNEKIYIAENGEQSYKDLLDAWRKDGWDPRFGFPDVVVMRFNGSDAERAAAIAELRGQGAAGSGPGTGWIERNPASQAGAVPVSPAAGGSGGSQPDLGRGNPGAFGTGAGSLPAGVSDRFGAVAQYTPAQLRARGLDDTQIRGLLGNDAVPDPIASYLDPPTQYLEDWSWRPLKDISADLNLSAIPKHVQNFGKFMDEMAVKAETEGLSPRDLIKAYTITQSSIQRQAVNADKLRALGLKLPKDITTIRPEGAFSEWLLTKNGKRYLDKAQKGQVDEAAIAELQKLFAPFGRQNDLAEAMRWAAANMPAKAKEASRLVAEAKKGGADRAPWRELAKDVRGIGPAKAGFFASLLGRGDIPTFDARQIEAHIGKGAKTDKYMKRGKGAGGNEAVDRLAKRQETLALSTPKALQPYYQHLTHHSVWDAIGGEKTTHDDVMRAMRLAGVAGLLGLPAAFSAVMNDQQEQY